MKKIFFLTVLLLLVPLGCGHENVNEVEEPKDKVIPGDETEQKEENKVPEQKEPQGEKEEGNGEEAAPIEEPTEEEEPVPDEDQEPAPSEDEVNNENKDPAPKPEQKEPKITKHQGKYEVTAPALHVRKGAGVTYDIIGQLKRNDVIEAVGKTDNGWYVVQYDGKEGFVNSQYLQPYKEKPKQPAPDPKPTPKPKPKPTIEIIEASGEYTVTASALNIRSGPGTNYERIGSLPYGTKVKVNGKTKDNWFRIQWNGKEGFISGQYITDQPVPPPDQGKPDQKEEVKPTYINGVLLVNKKYGLPPSYAPGESKEAKRAFEEMAKEAKKHGFHLEAFSTYRSYSTQKRLYEAYVKRDGQKEADRYSARPGHSEHQTGLAFDIGEVGKSGTRFQESDATRWMAENSYKFGFILRYPKGKEHITGYMYEPWHFRYVGKDLATKIYNSGLTLEEYLGVQ